MPEGICRRALILEGLRVHDRKAGACLCLGHSLGVRRVHFAVQDTVRERKFGPCLPTLII